VSTEIHYSALRDDWVKGAELIARLIHRSQGGAVCLTDFPRQWLPLFVYFGATWRGSTSPPQFIPLVSDLGEEEVLRLCQSADSQDALRVLVEACASLDALLADVLYRLDRRVEPRVVPQRLPLTGWQSYGRPEILELNKLVASTAKANQPTAVLLPCARKRPYTQSKTHRRIWDALALRAIVRSCVDSAVVSSIGIVPQALWNHPVVLAYDSGVPDVYRVLRLMRIYFGKARYKSVIDCLEFKPYSDCLQIISREGLVESIEQGPRRRSKTLPMP